MFIKNREDFTCEHCNQAVRGNGYTNHCSHCLWSKHVDNNPGDRAVNCGGLMPPVSFERRRGAYYLVHRCQRCGAEKHNRLAPADNLAALAGL